VVVVASVMVLSVLLVSSERLLMGLYSVLLGVGIDYPKSMAL
jgi:hypothetical protein